jgi:hypothetical protein
LLHLLNKHYGRKYAISDEHTNISPCVLPEWLPELIIRMMVEEFSRRLRMELKKLQNGISELRGRALTSNTVRMSLESIGSLGYEGPEEAETIGAWEFAG